MPTIVLIFETAPCLDQRERKRDCGLIVGDERRIICVHRPRPGMEGFGPVIPDLGEDADSQSDRMQPG